MKLSFDMDESLYENIKSAAKAHQRSIAAEIRFQLIRIYGDKK